MAKATRTLHADGRITVRREPSTYERWNGHSFFADVAAATARRDPGAIARLNRHEREVKDELERRGQALSTRAREAGAEFRTNPTSALGTGGDFTPPLWMIDRFASAARAGRPLADLLQPEPLPPGVASVHIPRMSTGSLTAIQTDGVGVASQDLVTVDANATVATIAGHLDVSEQLFELSPGGFDAAAFVDLSRAYNRSLETQLLTGSGTNGQLLGVTNVSGIPAANLVAGGSLTTVAQQWQAFGQCAANVGNNRLLPVEVWLFAPRRWYWLASSVDNNNRPIASPGNTGPHTTDLDPAGGARPYGPVLGAPVYLDGAIPAGSSADTIYALRVSDMFLWESEPKVIAAQNPLSGSLQVRLSLHRYCAFIPQRYPSGIGAVTALAQPSNF